MVHAVEGSFVIVTWTFIAFSVVCVVIIRFIVIIVVFFVLWTHSIDEDLLGLDVLVDVDELLDQMLLLNAEAALVLLLLR